MAKQKPKRGRPKNNRPQTTCRIYLDVLKSAETKRLKQQAEEGTAINKLEWISRLVSEAGEKY